MTLNALITSIPANTKIHAIVETYVDDILQRETIDFLTPHIPETIKPIMYEPLDAIKSTEDRKSYAVTLSMDFEDYFRLFVK